MAALHENRPSSRAQERNWTASTAGRLLRPLQSSLAALYKSGAASHHENHPPVDQTSTPQGDTCTAAHFNNIFFAQRKSKVTYRAKKAASRDPGHISATSCDQTPAKPYVSLTLPTPFRPDFKDSLGDKDKSYADRKLSQPFSDALKPPLLLPGNGAVAEAALDRTVVEKFRRLLEATRPSRSKYNPLKCPQTGAKSLLSLSLRRIPDYAEAEEGLRRSEDPDDRSNVSLELLEWLEDIEKLTFQPKLCLRESVRTQGIWLLRKAVAENLIGVDMVKQTVTWCAANEEDDAARAIAEAFMACDLARDSHTTVRHVDGKSYVESGALDVIAEFCNSSSNLSPFSLFNTALSSRSLSLFVLPSEKGVMYTSQAVRAVTSKSRHWNDALQLLQTILCEACGTEPLAGDKLPNRLKRTERPRSPSLMYAMPGDRPNLDTQNAEFITGVFEAVQELCIIIVSMAYISKFSPMRFSDGERAACDLLVRVLRDAALGSMRLYSREGTIQNAKNTGIAPVVCVVLLADLFIAMMALDPVSCSIAPDRPQDQHLKYISQFHEAHQSSIPLIAGQSQANFLRDLAVNCENLRKGKGFALLKELTTALLQRGSSHTSIKRIVTKLSLEAALFFAQRTHNPTHVMFASDLEKRVQNATRRNTVSTPARSKRSSIRWDGGLCEWLAATPADERGCFVPEIQQRSVDEEANHIKRERDRDPLCAKETGETMSTRSLARDATSTEPKTKYTASLPSRLPKPKRRFIDFLTNDDDFHDELALDAPRPLRDITNTIRPSKQRRTL